MRKVNWMNILSWSALFGCLIVAFLFGYYQWNRLATAQENRRKADSQIATQDMLMQQALVKDRPIVRQIAAEVQPTEDSHFLEELGQLMGASRVRQIRVFRTSLSPLPALNNVPKTDKASGGTATNTTGTGARYQDTQKTEADKKNERSIANLPLDVRAIPLGMEIEGPFFNISQFIARIQKYRYQRRAINLNSAQIFGADDRGMSRAILMITRFVRPPETTKPPAGDSGTTSQPVSGETAKSTTSGLASGPPVR